MVCYRHPNREAGRRCTRCGKPACSECLVQAQVGSHCLECAKASQPDLKTRARFWSAKEPLLITKILIGMNLAMFIGILIWSADPGALSGAITNAHLNLGLSREVLEQRIVWQSDDGTRFVTVSVRMADDGARGKACLVGGVLHRFQPHVAAGEPVPVRGGVADGEDFRRRAAHLLVDANAVGDR